LDTAYPRRPIQATVTTKAIARPPSGKTRSSTACMTPVPVCWSAPRGTPGARVMSLGTLGRNFAWRAPAYS